MPTNNARVMWQDVFAMGFSHQSFTYPYPAKGGVYSNKAAMLLLNHPHFESGQTVIENRKTTATAYRVGGIGFEYQQGHKMPKTTWEFDVTAHNMCQTLKTFFSSTGYTTSFGGVTGAYQFKTYTNPNPDRYLTLVRKFSDSSADSHRMSGVIAQQIQFTGNENTAFKASVSYVGRDISYTYTWNPNVWLGTSTGDDDTFDTTLDPLLWKNANLAIGFIFEGGAPGFTASTSGDVVTINHPTGWGLASVIDYGSYFVFGDTAANKALKYGPIKSFTQGANSTTVTLETGTGPASAISATGSFKIINFLHTSGIDLTITNNAVSKAYDEANVFRHIYGDLTGSGTLKIPYSEIPSADGGSASGYTGSAWLNFYLAGAILPVWLWWGDPWDCVEDSTDEGDFGIRFNMKATGEGVEDENTEMVVSFPFDMCGSNYGTGTVDTGPTVNATSVGFVKGTATDFIGLGADILAVGGAAVGVYRGDTIKIQGVTTTYTVRYPIYTTYIYLNTTAAGALSGKSYSIKTEGIKINLGVGGWASETSTL